MVFICNYYIKPARVREPFKQSKRTRGHKVDVECGVSSKRFHLRDNSSSAWPPTWATNSRFGAHLSITGALFCLCLLKSLKSQTGVQNVAQVLEEAKQV